MKTKKLQALSKLVKHFALHPRVSLKYGSYIASHPRLSLKYGGLWVNSQLTGHSPLEDEMPWMGFGPIEWLEGHLKPEMRVFEYGSGGSTLFLCRRVNGLVSVEHDKAWYERISRVKSEKGLTNLEYILCEPEVNGSGESPAYGTDSYTSTNKHYVNRRFKAYVETIDKYQDRSFDLVIVDGRARASCVKHALPKIRSGGYLMLDDSWRLNYGTAIALLTGLRRTDFLGPLPYSIRFGQTSVWQVLPSRSPSEAAPGRMGQPG